MNSPESVTKTYWKVDITKYGQTTGGVDDVEIDNAEQTLSVHFPASYRYFLKKYGTFTGKSLVILGLGVSTTTLPSLFCANLVIRTLHPQAPTKLVPVAILEKGVFACLDARQPDLIMVVWDIRKKWGEELPKIASNFELFLDNYIESKKQPLPSWRHFEKHVLASSRALSYDHAKGGKLPRNHDWRPYRFCIQDVLFGATVVRHWREYNCLQVDVFLTAHIPEYEPLAGAYALATFLLSEAYKCGGSMEIRFTEQVEDRCVPAELHQLAARYQLTLGQTQPDRISAEEAKALYAALTNFSPALQTRLIELEKENRLRVARACYVVHHGVWTQAQVEMIVLGSERPGSILSGSTQPHQWHLYQHDIFHARAATMVGMFNLCLARRERQENGITYDMEDDTYSLQSTFDGETYAQVYQANEPLNIPWLHNASQPLEIPVGIPFKVYVRARGAVDLAWHLPSELSQQIRQINGQPTFLLVPYDFVMLPADWLNSILKQIEQGGVQLLVCPETILNLDTDAARRLASSRILRQ